MSRFLEKDTQYVTRRGFLSDKLSIQAEQFDGREPETDCFRVGYGVRICRCCRPSYLMRYSVRLSGTIPLRLRVMPGPYKAVGFRSWMFHL